MADGQECQELNYSVNKHYKPDTTKVIVVVKGLEVGILQSKKMAQKAKNARVNLSISKDGDMGTIVLMEGNLELNAYRVKIDPEDIGHNWLAAPDSYYSLGNDCVKFYLKRNPNERH